MYRLGIDPYIILTEQSKGVNTVDTCLNWVNWVILVQEVDS